MREQNKIIEYWENSGLLDGIQVEHKFVLSSLFEELACLCFKDMDRVKKQRKLFYFYNPNYDYYSLLFPYLRRIFGFFSIKDFENNYPNFFETNDLSPLKEVDAEKMIKSLNVKKTMDYFINEIKKFDFEELKNNSYYSIDAEAEFIAMASENFIVKLIKDFQNKNTALDV